MAQYTASKSMATPIISLVNALQAVGITMLPPAQAIPQRLFRAYPQGWQSYHMPSPVLPHA